MGDHLCDYCGDDLTGRTFRLRAIRMTRLHEGGPESPLVQAWCGECEAPDDIDPEADAALMRVLAAQINGGAS